MAEKKEKSSSKKFVRYPGGVINKCKPVKVVSDKKLPPEEK